MKFMAGQFIAWIVLNALMYVYDIWLLVFIVTNAEGLNEIGRMGYHAFVWFGLLVICIVGTTRIVTWYRQGKFHRHERDDLQQMNDRTVMLGDGDLSIRGHFIITGTSRGIGEQLAIELLRQGYHVYGISRREAESLREHDRYIHISFDLSVTDKIDPLLRDIIERIPTDDADMICLVNNAAMLEPLSAIDHCSPEEILRPIQINLTAPITLTSTFIKLTENIEARRKVVNVTSASANMPAASMSLYCSSKAGMNSFTKSVGLEQAGRTNPVEIIAYDPGMIDTDMQRTAREQDERQFDLALFFREAHETGQLQTAEEAARRLLNAIRKRIQPGSLVCNEDFKD
ncbi:MAG: family NAD(P)-dependent oxidoreductase [Paenibacillus sp.]|nr:family NAD(P)-dependent oxidoreductase [Paenibacillus sp.]